MGRNAWLSQILGLVTVISACESATDPRLTAAVDASPRLNVMLASDSIATALAGVIRP
jgi:hypothetical protein